MSQENLAVVRQYRALRAQSRAAARHRTVNPLDDVSSGLELLLSSEATITEAGRAALRRNLSRP